MKRMIPVLSVLTIASAALAAEPGAEVKRVVDTFSGKWKMQVTAALPGVAEKVKFPGTMDCQPVAASSGVRCTIAGKSDKLGPIAQECLIAHDPEGTGVHLMCVTNGGEVHDHKGAWMDDKTLGFEPFKGTSQGKPAVEDVKFEWKSAKRLVARSVTTVGDQKIDFEMDFSRK